MTAERLSGRPHQAVESARTTLRPAVDRLVPWTVPLLAAIVALLLLDVPVGYAARHALYFAAGVVLPGVLLMRALWRSTGNWAEDIGLGATAGFAYELLGWALFTALGWQSALAVWPLLLLVCFAAVPRLRPYWRIAEPSPLPVLWSWGVALSLTALVVILSVGMSDHPVPPEGTTYYADLLYHLSMVHELMRSVPPELPQVAGERLDYHWFANAQMAAGVDITRVPADEMLFRLWLLPMTLVSVLVCAALGRVVTRAWWAGVLVPVLTLPGQVLYLFPSVGRLDLGVGLIYLSPSQTFGLVAGTAAAVFLIEALFRGGGWGVWVLAVAVAVVGGGAKPTTLPLLLGGVGLSAVFLLVRERRIPWRSVIAGAGLLVTAVLTMITVAGSTSGSGFQLFAVVRTVSGYKEATGDRSMPATGGWLLPALTGDKVAVAGGLVELVGVVLGHLLLLVGLAVLVARKTRTDPVAWFLAGVLIAGWLGLNLVDHPSSSEAYFLRSSVPFAAAAAACLVVAAVRGRSRRTAAAIGAAGLGLGVLVGAIAELTDRTPTGDRPDRIEALAQPILATLGLFFLVGVGWWLLVRRRPALAGSGLALLVLVPVGVLVASTADRALSGSDSQYVSSAIWPLQPDEQAAAEWLGSHSGPDDVVVTNTACRTSQATHRYCDARGYLVSGIAGRRTLIEGWAYTQQAMAEHGTGGRGYFFQPSPWPDRSALTKQVLTAPTPQLLDRLYREYGVRWIYADLHNGKVSPELDRLAQLRHQESMVRIYQLPGR